MAQDFGTHSHPQFGNFPMPWDSYAWAPHTPKAPYIKDQRGLYNYESDQSDPDPIKQ